MGRIVLFGAGGRAGRQIWGQARARGHDVVAVMRDPSAYPEIHGVAGDVTDVTDVTRLTAGADAVVNAGARTDVLPDEFFSAATRALIEGLKAGRLLVIGIGTTLESAPGIRLMDAPDFPSEAAAFSTGHAVELELLQASPTDLDWVVITPPPVLIGENIESGVPLRVGDGPALLQSSDTTFTYTDLAVATVDELENPTHHRTQIAVARR